jgi:hypothetical protein
MDFNNLANSAQDLLKNAQGMMNSNPDLVNQAESMIGMDLNMDGKTGNAAAPVSQVDDVSASDEAVTTEQTTLSNDEVANEEVE